jgi:hypothetical protein
MKNNDEELIWEAYQMPVSEADTWEHPEAPGYEPDYLPDVDEDDEDDEDPAEQQQLPGVPVPEPLSPEERMRVNVTIESLIGSFRDFGIDNESISNWVRQAFNESDKLQWKEQYEELLAKKLR